MHSIVNIGILLFLTITIVRIHAGPAFPGDRTSDSSLELNVKKKCGENEEYKQCGSACPPSCRDFFCPQKRILCTAQCVSGCFCKSGLYRARDGRCVKPLECCKGQNEYYTKCGTACPETCTYKPQFCTKNCIEGCFCRTNYIRIDNSTNSPCVIQNAC